MHFAHISSPTLGLDHRPRWRAVCRTGKPPLAGTRLYAPLAAAGFCGGEGETDDEDC